jgi:uncharacterized membrane protein YkvA (DUF1232 family)
MKTQAKDLTDSDFIELIIRGASRLTPGCVQKLVSELPEVRNRFNRLNEAGRPDAERQFAFLSEVLEHVWTDKYHQMPYGAALEAAFAISYFVREGDVIPDTLGAIGFIDDIAVAQIVLLRNEVAYRKFSDITNIPLANISLGTDI